MQEITFLQSKHQAVVSTVTAAVRLVTTAIPKQKSASTASSQLEAREVR